MNQNEGQLNELALFAGAGGGLLGTRLLGFRPVYGVELSPYCRESLIRRQEEGHLEPFPLWDDVQTFDGLPWRGLVDVVTAGFPCQPFSAAGKQEADNDPRNMWPATMRILREVQPRAALLENVPGLARHAYFHEILGRLCEGGFDARWAIISAAGVGAPHLRERLWILAYPKHGGVPERRRTEATGSKSDQQERVSRHERAGCGKQTSTVLSDSNGELCQRGEECDCTTEASGKTQHGSDPERLCNAVPDPNGERLEGRNINGTEGHRKTTEGPTRSPLRANINWWEAEPEVGRVADGMAHRVDQLRAIGNGQVSSVVAEAWRHLTSEVAEHGGTLF